MIEFALPPRQVQPSSNEGDSLATATNSGVLVLPETMHSLRVLIADDDTFMLDIIEELLAAFGIRQVQRAKTGESVLRLVDSSDESVQLLICDLNMAGMDGIEILRHLADRSFQGAIIVISGSDARILDSVTNLAREHSLNLLGVLAKPLDITKLHGTLLRYSLTKFPTPTIENEAAAPRSLTFDEVHNGILSGCVQVAFQPKVCLRDRQVVGAECLLRWNDPRYGFLPPGVVITSAERYGLITPLTEQILRLAVAAVADWSRHGAKISVAVNISSRSLNTLNLPELLSSIVRQGGVETGSITLEITETGLMADHVASLEVMNRLRLKGFKLSIDDFGIGYSSMEKLKNMPFNELKVDRSFVVGAREHAIARAIVDSSVRLAHAIQMRVVAEGTEDQDDLDFVIRAGCDDVQGDVIAKPMPADEFMAWKQKWDFGSTTLRFGKSSNIGLLG